MRTTILKRYDNDDNPSGGKISGRAETSELQPSLAEQGSVEEQERLPVEAPVLAFENQEKLVGDSEIFSSAHIEESETPFQQEGTIDHIVPDDSNSDLSFESLPSKNLVKKNSFDKSSRAESSIFHDKVKSEGSFGSEKTQLETRSMSFASDGSQEDHKHSGKYNKAAKGSEEPLSADGEAFVKTEKNCIKDNVMPGTPRDRETEKHVDPSSFAGTKAAQSSRLLSGTTQISGKLPMEQRTTKVQMKLANPRRSLRMVCLMTASRNHSTMKTTSGSWPEAKLINPKLYRQMSTELAPQIEPFKCQNL
jgi:hypothetical protein